MLEKQEECSLQGDADAMQTPCARVDRWQRQREHAKEPLPKRPAGQRRLIFSLIMSIAGVAVALAIGSCFRPVQQPAEQWQKRFQQVGWGICRA